eukprot:gnl/TRDRNA2_/TRDRNA2_166025_c0_seq1.p1 gnl/TRDRNA2_/TRDRNA2_166025_c0~~gnl/TRDRNA2_/TRDRNA2_166025_c0_seq1.p1  ORF type:complete len:762 (-),score=133.76 gnl/TRDRNA2_/TRDRNA2_166025_c0_seq1:195-2480(-)
MLPAPPQAWNIEIEAHLQEQARRLDEQGDGEYTKAVSLLRRYRLVYTQQEVERMLLEVSLPMNVAACVRCLVCSERPGVASASVPLSVSESKNRTFGRGNGAGVGSNAVPSEVAHAPKRAPSRRAAPSTSHRNISVAPGEATANASATRSATGAGRGAAARSAARGRRREDGPDQPDRRTDLIRAAEFRRDWCRRNQKLGKLQQWDEAVLILQQKVQKVVVMRDMAAWHDRPQLPPWMPRLLPQIFAELQDVLEGKVEVEDNEKYGSEGDPGAREPPPVRGMLEFRDPASAFLIAQLPFTEEEPIKGKDRLIYEAQPFTHRPLQRVQGEKARPGDDALHALIRRGLVISSYHGPPGSETFWLTNIGRHWAELAKQKHEDCAGQPVRARGGPGIDISKKELKRSIFCAARRGGFQEGVQRARKYLHKAAAVFDVVAATEGPSTVLRAQCPSETEHGQDYAVVVQVAADHSIVDASCECKFGQDPANKDVFCKHAYAVHIRWKDEMADEHPHLTTGILGDCPGNVHGSLCRGTPGHGHRADHSQGLASAAHAASSASAAAAPASDASRATAEAKRMRAADAAEKRARGVAGSSVAAETSQKRRRLEVEQFGPKAEQHSNEVSVHSSDMAVSSAAPPGGLSMEDLKACVQALGASTKGCVDRSDLEQLLKQYHPAMAQLELEHRGGSTADASSAVHGVLVPTQSQKSTVFATPLRSSSRIIELSSSIEDLDSLQQHEDNDDRDFTPPAPDQKRMTSEHAFASGK